MDVVLLEYQEQNPELNQWIKKTLADPQSPEIFLFGEEMSANRLWQLLRLGVREIFTFPIGEEEFKEAVRRILAGKQN